ncbi:CinA family nicotinamide mononucleotide deamidase-related protein [Flavobacterium agricola]|uniref:CinA-like protein n=1 Tax=Flavobacterium agricola TaxID=2870839 RepID=A0ABY6M117_9FLAO|nr:CinA family nicotinamide mononucleotide deamidase-related protein [Flavobacterium agricola]UYW01512.1 CinA family nicotinamide mononucleotide deamidase-related protein [Flavobacterium agricola]
MKAAVVTIGDEILIGQIVDTNSAFIAKQLDELGFQVVEVLSIADQEQAIVNMLQSYQNKVDLVVITGGLGPTKDDITKKTICKFFNDDLVLNQEVLTHVTRLLEDFYNRPVSEINKQQALVPSRAKILFNKVGTAPGMILQNNKTFFVSLPGVPFEMKYIVENELKPWVITNFDAFYNVHQTIITQGVGESLLAERIANWENNLPPAIKLAYLPSPGMVKLRLSSSGNDKQAIEQSISNQVSMLALIIGDCIISYDEQLPLPHQIYLLLKSKKQTIAVAESCTGGKLATCFTEIPGISSVFKGGVITYATDSKVNLLGVSQDTILEQSVVSAQVAEQMATQAKNKFQTDYAIASTGNAGPLKGDSDAEVGTVHIGIATPHGTFSEKFMFGQPREKVVKSAVNKALELVYKELIKKNN